MKRSLMLLAVLLIATQASAADGTCEPDAIPAFTCNFNCWHATISGSRAERPMNNCGPNGNEICPEETTPIEHTYAVTRNGLCGSCGAGATEPCGYATQAEVLQCVDYFVRHGVPVPKGNPRQRVDVYPYLGGWVIGPESMPGGGGTDRQVESQPGGGKE